MSAKPDSPDPSTQPNAAALEQRIATLEQALQQQTQTAARLQSELRVAQAVIHHLPYAVYWKNADLVYQGCNQRFATDLGLPNPGAVVGHTDAELPWRSGEEALFAMADQQVLANNSMIYDDDETVIYPDGTQEWFETYKIPLHDDAGQVMGVLATYINITMRKQAEATVRAQAQLLQEISTPIIPITDDVLVIPLIGALDSQRAQQVLETLLEQVASSRARVVILDITGIPLVDTQVAHALIQTGRAVQLLGARLVLTGIRPEVAQAIVGLGVQLQGITTHSTLQHGLAAIIGITS